MNIDEIVASFDRDGYVQLPQAIGLEELAALQEDSAHIIEEGYEGKEPESDYFFDALPDTGEVVFHRVQYVFPKARNNSFIKLLAHPLVLQVVQRLLGDDFICEAEAFVFKVPGNGKEVPVHCDGDPSQPDVMEMVFNVDYYLDDATPENGCLLAAPGSHKLNLSGEEVRAQGFDYPGLIELPVKAGDVLFHNVKLVHGSRRNSANSLRRTLYYAFHSLSAAAGQGEPRSEGSYLRPGQTVPQSWIDDRLRLMMHAIDLRKESSYGRDEVPFPYQAPAGYDVAWPSADETMNYRPALGYSKYY